MSAQRRILSQVQINHMFSNGIIRRSMFNSPQSKYSLPNSPQSKYSLPNSLKVRSTQYVVKFYANCIMNIKFYLLTPGELSKNFYFSEVRKERHESSCCSHHERQAYPMHKYSHFIVFLRYICMDSYIAAVILTIYSYIYFCACLGYHWNPQSNIPVLKPQSQQFPSAVLP